MENKKLKNTLIALLAASAVFPCASAIRAFYKSAKEKREAKNASNIRGDAQNA